jgi:hypothetical protein
MKVSRGGFLTTCGAALLGAGLDAPSVLVDAGTREATTSPTCSPIDIAFARAADFTRHVNTAFDVCLPTEPSLSRRLVLTNVVERREPQTEQFAVLFEDGGSTPLTDGIYQFQHSRLGRFDLFIAPVGRRDGRRLLYEACFSRHVQAGC